MFYIIYKKYRLFLCWCPSANLLMHTVLRFHGNIPAEDNEEDRSLCQVHSSRLHNDTHVPCSLQSLHSKGIGMIMSIWNCPWTIRYTIRVSLHPCYQLELVAKSVWGNFSTFPDLVNSYWKDWIFPTEIMINVIATWKLTRWFWLTCATHLQSSDAIWYSNLSYSLIIFPSSELLTCQPLWLD